MRAHRLSASVLDGKDGGSLLFAADVAPVPGLEGVHEVSFTPSISGAYLLALAFEGGRQLPGSPFAVRVKTDESVAGNCKLYGGGLTQATAGEPTSFHIQGGRASLRSLDIASC
jgi:hypothetical protein